LLTDFGDHPDDDGLPRRQAHEFSDGRIVADCCARSELDGGLRAVNAGDAADRLKARRWRGAWVACERGVPDRLVAALFCISCGTAALPEKLSWNTFGEINAPVIRTMARTYA
jgi:hypothetical protein